jgi:ribonuclease HI/ADP-ribose pyrophosphatase YjhB (NUDIX family)
MKQRIVVQAIIQTEGKTLLLRRAQGRPGVVGKYELPGGTLNEGEQPDDCLRRHLKNDAGLSVGDILLDDAMSMVNREEGDIQHVFIVYRVSGVLLEAALQLGSSYDKYEWKTTSELQQNDLRDSAFYLLRLQQRTNQHNIEGSRHLNDDVIKSSYVTKIYSDGGSRGNPGPSACAFVILDDQDQIIEQGESYLGITTNNQAEYHGVRLGLEKAIEMELRKIHFFVDSMLVANQLRGMYKIKNRELWPINERIVELIQQFDSVVFTHVPREQNHFADALVNKCLDRHKADAA